MRSIAICAVVLALGCDAPGARDAGVRHRARARQPAPRVERSTPEIPVEDPPFDFRLAEWMPDVYVGSTRHCRMIGFEAQRRRSIAECTTGTWSRGALAWDHTTRIELATTDPEREALERDPPRIGCARDARVRILESRRRQVRAVLVDRGAPFGCGGPRIADPHHEVARDPAPTDLRDAQPGTVAVCYVTALHGVEREGDELLADIECRQGQRTARVSVYAPLSRTEQVARLAPARIAELRLDTEYADEGELVSVLDAPWFDPRLEGGSTEALLPDR